MDVKVQKQRANGFCLRLTCSKEVPRYFNHHAICGSVVIVGKAQK